MPNGVHIGEGISERIPSSVSIRPAVLEDSNFLAKAILHSSRSHLPCGIWDLLVQGDEEDRLDFLELLSLMEEKTFCHYGNFLVAEEAGEVIAALAGFDPGEPGILAPGHAIAAAFAEFGASDAEVSEAFGRLETYQTGLPTQKHGFWTVEWVWTTPRMQRRGIASAMISRVLRRGRERNYRSAQITTFSTNLPARRIYEKAGFRVSEEKCGADFERMMGAPGLVRYELNL
jgi:ribosomal protein S18 acetylase RimI-like enzyme